ncbi:hypothetical protein B566_EDAN017703, partial [Ephemera danica]
MGDAAIAALKNRADSAVAEIHALEREFQALTARSQQAGDPNLEKLKSENCKLQYRLKILRQAIEKEKGVKNQTMEPQSNSILETLTQLFTCAVAKAFPDLPDPPAIIIPSTSPKFGDYQCNSAMPICQMLKGQGIKANPREVATQILNCVPQSGLVEKLEVAGAGFVNVWLDRKFGCAALREILLHGAKPPPIQKRSRVVVDFSSPNIAKEMHVGHLRVNHVGDWGTQFGMLIAHLEDKFPNFRTESPPIGDLQAFYKESKARFDQDANFKQRAYSCVVKLQAHDPGYIKAWQLICDVSRKAFQEIYNRLDITIEEKGESFYHDKMLETVEMLEKG